jgi:hypothetical protein
LLAGGHAVYVRLSRRGQGVTCGECDLLIVANDLMRGRGTGGWRASANRGGGQVDAFAGFDYTISHTYSDNADGAVVEWNMSGDYAGKPVSLDVVTAYHFLGGRIVSERNYWDNAALQAQLGWSVPVPFTPVFGRRASKGEGKTAL